MCGLCRLLYSDIYFGKDETIFYMRSIELLRHSYVCSNVRLICLLVMVYIGRFHCRHSLLNWLILTVLSPAILLKVQRYETLAWNFSSVQEPSKSLSSTGRISCSLLQCRICLLKDGAITMVFRWFSNFFHFVSYEVLVLRHRIRMLILSPSSGRCPFLLFEDGRRYSHFGGSLCNYYQKIKKKLKEISFLQMLCSVQTRQNPVYLDFSTLASC
jgi:hypothetical protein